MRIPKKDGISRAMHPRDGPGWLADFFQITAVFCVQRTAKKWEESHGPRWVRQRTRGK